MRSHAKIFLATVAVSCSAWLACGFSDEGLLVDGGADGPPLPNGCTTLDAACLGNLTAGWRPVSVTDAACAPGFEAGALFTNPRVESGGCACGPCEPVGSFSCKSTVAISGGDNCNDPTLVNAVPGICATASAQHLEAHNVQATGSVTCVAANDAGAGATADSLTVCVPGCTADFCGGASRCILSEGDVPCPSGFTLFAKAGTGADPGCRPCACEAGAPGLCTGSVTGFESSSCTDSGLVNTYPIGTCNVFDDTIKYQSVLVALQPPDASCFAVDAAPDPGDASLTGVKTICCQ